MADLLRIGSNSLLNLQQALNTTGHNITNVNTEGYSRQSVNFATADYMSGGSLFLGQGATIQSIDRSNNAFLTNQVQNFTSSQNRYQAQLTYLSRLDEVLGNSSNSLNTSLQNLFNSVQEVAANPSGIPERQVLLENARNLVNRQQSLNQTFNNLNGEINTELKASVSQINGYIDNISMLNKQIATAIGSSNGELPNDLLDKRDLLIKQLAEKVAVNKVDQPDGTVNLFIGRGQPLVVGSDVTHLVTQVNAYDSSQLEIGIEGQKSASGISQLIEGGELQGLLDFRNNNLLPAQAQSGLLLLSLTDSFNTQHGLGMDLNGDAGGNFFTPQGVTVSAHANNAGAALPAVTISDATSIQASDYRLGYDGAQWQLVRLSDGTSVSGSGPLVLDGMSVDISAGAASAGDSFVFNPAREAASTFALAIKDPRKFAAGGAVALYTQASNTGTASLEALTASDPATLPLATPLVLTFDPDALGPGVPGFSINGGADGTVAYDPATESNGKDFTLAAFGISFHMAGSPATGDSFTLSDNSGATGDNGNAFALAGLQQQKLVNGKQDSFQSYYSSMVAQVGVNTRQTDANLSVESSLLDQSVAYRDSVSGVNLDEEASNMLRYQQAYQASAQLVKMASDLFQTILNSIR